MGRILLQYMVDMAAKVESYKLNYIRTHQTEIRADLYNGENLYSNIYMHMHQYMSL